ncbi:MAG: 50S ribosomal protein L13 [Phycisphaerae bacterium]|nr:50S ribosomal protein L13 [Phycisphaerae bacterium]
MLEFSVNTTKTYMAKKGEVDQKWYLVDVAGIVMGRAATEVATILMGKHRPTYTPHVDTGEFVVVINADKVKVTGNNKAKQRQFEHFTYYPGGHRQASLEQMLKTKPELAFSEVVRCMLPKTKLGAVMLSKLKVYKGSTHPHQAQMPEKYEL